jgi:3-oxoacyl-[acyl-carrier-protein] synthase-3
VTYHEAGSAIAGAGMAVPERRVSNREIAARLGVDEGWITKRTGARERPWAREGERMSEFAATAGREALSRSDIEPMALDLVVVATSTADEITPNAAPLVAGLVGAERAGAFDIGSACTGWLAGLATACGQIESGRARNALVVGADFLSRYSICPIATPRRCSPMAPGQPWSRLPRATTDGSGRSCCAPTPPEPS